jgi:16S rRNA processing protein RimM
MTELVIGYITKPHGLRGEVLVHLVTNRVADRMRAGEVFSSDRGRLAIVSCAPQGDRWRVRFDQIADRETAESFAKVELRAAPITDPDALWIHDLVGSSVQLVDGTPVGIVESVEANPASDLLVFADGTLVPLVFVVSSSNRVVVIDPPDGLLELNKS